MELPKCKKYVLLVKVIARVCLKVTWSEKLFISVKRADETLLVGVTVSPRCKYVLLVKVINIARV